MCEFAWNKIIFQFKMSSNGFNNCETCNKFNFSTLQTDTYARTHNFHIGTIRGESLSSINILYWATRLHLMPVGDWAPIGRATPFGVIVIISLKLWCINNRKLVAWLFLVVEQINEKLYIYKYNIYYRYILYIVHTHSAHVLIATCYCVCYAAMAYDLM